MPLSNADPLLSDCPDYARLAPSPSLKRRRLKLDQGLGKKLSSKKKGKEEDGAEAVDSDAATDELRMCSSCVRLVERRLNQLEKEETSILVALYNKMQLVMGEADKLQPAYQEVVDSLL